jgi:hypothetical protein
VGACGFLREIKDLGVAFALHYLQVRRDTVMNIKALVASLVLGVVGTSSAAMASPFEARREAGHPSFAEHHPIHHGPIIEHRPGFDRRRDDRRGFDRRRDDRRGFDRRRDDRFDRRRDDRRW